MKVKGRNECWFSKSIMKKEFRLTRDVEEKVITIYYSSIGDMNGLLSNGFMIINILHPRKQSLHIMKSLPYIK